MGERLKRGWIAYRKYKLVMRIIWAVVGVVVGISGCIVFTKVYHNYNAAVWAGLSAVFAIIFLHLNFSVRRDCERQIPRLKFTVIMFIGVTGLMAGVAGFFTNIALGIARHETGKKCILPLEEWGRGGGEGRMGCVCVCWVGPSFKFESV